MHCIDSAYRYKCRTQLGLCVCSHTGEFCKNGKTDRDAIWGLIDVDLRNNVLDGVSYCNSTM